MQKYIQIERHYKSCIHYVYVSSAGIQCPHRGAVFSYHHRHITYPYGENEREACNVFFVWEMLRPLLQGKFSDTQGIRLMQLLQYVSSRKWFVELWYEYLRYRAFCEISSVISAYRQYLSKLDNWLRCKDLIQNRTGGVLPISVFTSKMKR